MEPAIFQRTEHPDLRRISAETLSTLLHERTEDLVIVDARYPFEYAGGHIQAAQNIFTEDQLRLFFAQLTASSSVVSSTTIIVFHCEFSSERGPRLCRLFRSIDRQHNLANYPSLSFPHVYLLDGGYSQFFQSSLGKTWCQPQAYISMFAQQHFDELQHHRQAKKIAAGRLRIEYYQPIPFQL